MCRETSEEQRMLKRFERKGPMMPKGQYWERLYEVLSDKVRRLVTRSKLGYNSQWAWKISQKEI